MTTIAEMKAQSTAQPQQTAAVARRERTIFDFLSSDPRVEKAITAVAGSFLTPDRFLRLAINAVKKTPTLLQCDPQTVLGAFMTSAGLGLEPNTVLQQAFLIPYKKSTKNGDQWIETWDCQFQVGARGFITLAHRSPHIDSIQSEAIHEGDHWKYMMGTNSFLEYSKELKNRGELIGSFCFTKLESGAEMATVLPLEEVYKIRSRSETYKALVRKIDEVAGGKAHEKMKAEGKLADTPWVMWEDDMAAKSATKKHAKQLPLAPGDMFAAAAALDTDGEGGIDLKMMTDPDIVRAVIAEGAEAAGAADERYGFPAIDDNPTDSVPGLNALATRNANAETVSTHDHPNTKTASAQASMPLDGGVSFQAVKDRLQNATDADVLAAEADLIKEVSDLKQRDELTAMYRSRKAQIDEDGQSRRPARAQRRQMSIE